MWFVEYGKSKLVVSSSHKSIQWTFLVLQWSHNSKTYNFTVNLCASEAISYTNTSTYVLSAPLVH